MPRLRQISVVGILPAIALLSGCRLDMQVQPKQNPLSRSDFFADQRSERPPVEGTVARGQLREDTYFYTGKAGNNPGDYMPFAVTKAILERGRERYNIYCAPCHSRVGDGNGLIPSRGFARKPPSFHDPRLQKAPLGYVYDVLRHYVRLRLADPSARPLEHRGLHPCASVGSKRNPSGRACGAGRAVGNP